MTVKVLKARDLTFVNRGSFGAYSKIKRSKNGVKVFSQYRVYKKSRTVSEALASEEFKGVTKEFKRLKKVRATMMSLVPKPKYLAIVEVIDDDGTTIYMPGYVMSHVEGKLVMNSTMTDEDTAVLSRAKMVFTDKGIRQNDDHTGNIIKVANTKKPKFVFIDAGGMRFVKNNNGQCDWS